MEKFSLILADPPWSYRSKHTGGSMSSGSADKYPTMELEEIKALDVRSIAARDCALFLWATVPMVQEAFEVMKAWGFAYKTLLVWNKTGKKLGLGYWFRGHAELLLFGIRGKVPAFRFPIKNVYDEPPSTHSRKPEFFRKICEKTHLEPRVELFAREEIEGWHSWGFDVRSDIVL